MDQLGHVIRDFIPEGEVTEADRAASHARLYGGALPDYVPDGGLPETERQSSRERQAERDARAQAALAASLRRQRKADVVAEVNKFLPRVSQYKTWHHLSEYLSRLPAVSLQYGLVAVEVSRTEDEKVRIYRRHTRPSSKLLEEYLENSRTPASPDPAESEVDSADSGTEPVSESAEQE